MNFLFIMVAARIINAINVNNYTDDYLTNYYKLCGGKGPFIKKPETFPFTKPSCDWKKYSSSIFYEYIHPNTSKRNFYCRQLLKERCGLEINDIVFWMDKQEKIIKECIDFYFTFSYYNGYKSDYNENFCKLGPQLPMWHPTQYDLPFCSANYAHFASNFLLFFNPAMLENSRTK